MSKPATTKQKIFRLGIALQLVAFLCFLLFIAAVVYGVMSAA
jgi:hypothetical protein